MVENLVVSLNINITDHVTTEMIHGVATVKQQAESGRVTRYVPHTVIALISNGGISSFKEDRKWLICSTRNSAIDQIVRATTLGASVIGRRLVMSEAVEQMWGGE